MEKSNIKIFSFLDENQGSMIGVHTSDGTFNLTLAFQIYQHAKGIRKPIDFSFLQVLVEMGYCSGSVIREILSESWVSAKKEQLLIETTPKYELPISRPTKIICLGRNYREHAKELDHEIPDEPIFFSKAPSSLIPHDKDIIIPEWLNTRVDHEAELALIVGKRCKNIAAKDALSYISGYTILNDITARDMQKKDIAQKRPWLRSKSIDTFCPVGPYIVPSDEIDNPHSLNINLKVNGKIRQKSSTSKMIFKIPDIVSYLSRFMTLEPGDIIATGTPHGVGPIVDGDLIEVTISEIGTLRNRVVKEASN